jgi:hypothetical protein
MKDNNNNLKDQKRPRTQNQNRGINRHNDNHKSQETSYSMKMNANKETSYITDDYEEMYQSESNKFTRTPYA